MRSIRVITLASIAVLLGSCEPTTDNQNLPSSKESQALKTQIQSWFPGAYSNYAQRHEDEFAKPVTDLDIRQLNTNGEPVFLFESMQRDSDTSSHEVYWLKTKHGSPNAELHFSYLTEDDLSLPITEVLAIAWQRVNPGCVIEVIQKADQISGQTNPDTCVFEHLLQGETRLHRTISLSEDSLTIENSLTAPGAQDSTDITVLNLQKHRVFNGWASSRTPAGPEQEFAGDWKLSTIFSIRDDGRINNIRDQNRESIGFGVQLAKLKWVEDKPQHMLLSIINMETGFTQAYTWFDPENEILELNLSWFQTNLELKQTDPAESEN
jgi:hypothetical protein